MRTDADSQYHALSAQQRNVKNVERFTLHVVHSTVDYYLPIPRIPRPRLGAKPVLCASGARSQTFFRFQLLPPRRFLEDGDVVAVVGNVGRRIEYRSTALLRQAACALTYRTRYDRGSTVHPYGFLFTMTANIYPDSALPADNSGLRRYLVVDVERKVPEGDVRFVGLVVGVSHGDMLSTVLRIRLAGTRNTAKLDRLSSILPRVLTNEIVGKWGSSGVSAQRPSRDAFPKRLPQRGMGNQDGIHRADAE